MNSKWQEILLTDIYEISSGLSKPASAFGSGYPFLSFKDVFHNYFIPNKLSQLVESSEKERKACSILRGDVFLTRTSETMHELGMSCVAIKNYDSASFNGFTKRLRKVNDCVYEVFPEYIGYYFRSGHFRKQMLALSSMSTRASLNNEMLGRLSLLLPPIKIQTGIAEVLKVLDDKAAVNKIINQTLEQMAQALFKSWFVDFEPVKAKIASLEEGGSQEDATLAAMSAISGKDTDALVVFEHEHPEQYAELKATAELFPSAMQDSELGEIPEGWNVSNIKDNVDVRDGTHASPKASDSGYHLVTSKNITSGYLERRGCYYISDADYNDVNKRSRVSCGDILISMIGTVGALYFVAENNVDYAIKNIGLIRTSERHDLQAFIFYHLKSKEGANYIQSRLAGTTQKYLSLKQLREIPLVMPTQDVLAAFNKKTFLREIHANQEIAETLASIRDTLLPKLLSGEITLPEAEQAVSEAENV